MKWLVYQKPLMISEHRNGMAAVGLRVVRAPVCAGWVRRPAKTLCSSSRHKIPDTEPGSGESAVNL